MIAGRLLTVLLVVVGSLALVFGALFMSLAESGEVVALLPTQTYTPSQTASATATNTPTLTPTHTSTTTSTATPTSTYTPSPTPSPTMTVVVSATATESPTRAPTQTQKPAPTTPSCVPRTDWPVYMVQAGDTLYGIATRTGTTVAELQDANCIPRSSTVITVGQRLRVPYLPAPQATPTHTPRPNPTDEPTPTDEPELPDATPTAPPPQETIVIPSPFTLTPPPPTPTLPTPTQVMTNTPPPTPATP